MTVRLPAAQGQILIQALRAAAADLDHPHRHARDDTPAHHDSPSHAAGRPGPTGTPPGRTAHPGAGVSTETPPSPEPARADPASSADTRVPAETPPAGRRHRKPHPRAAPRRPRTRPVPVPVPLPQLPLPPHRHPPHPPLGPPRQDQLPQPHLALRSAPRHRARTGLPHHPRARRGVHLHPARRHTHARQPRPARPSQDISALHDAAVTAETISAPGDRLDLDLAIWSTFANARVARERAATRVTA